MFETILIILTLFLMLSPKIAAALSFSTFPEAIAGLVSRCWKILTRESGHQISGLIFDLDSDAPLPNALVEITGLGNQSHIKQLVFSDFSGRFSLNCPAGSYRVLAEKYGFTLAKSPSGKLLSGPLSHYLGEPVVAQPGSTISLTIALKMTNPKLVEKQSAQVAEFQRATNLLSILILPLLATGLVISLSDLSYQFSWVGVLRVVLYIALSFIAVQRLLLPKISGTIVDLETRKTLNHCLAHVFQTTKNGRSLFLVNAAAVDKHGRFSLNLPAGRYQLFSSKYDYQTLRADRLLISADYAETEVTIYLVNHKSAATVHQHKTRFLRSGN